MFVRDGFSFWAFLLAPLWMLRHRLWLVLIGYVVVVGAIETAGAACPARRRRRESSSALLISLLVGLEAGTLRRFTLSRRGWKNVGVVGGDDLEDAERRFFDAWLRRTQSPSSATARADAAGARAAAPMPRRPPASDVIGLFPEPGAQR